MRAGRNGGHRSRTAGVKGGRWRQRGATLAEYLPPLLFVLMIALPAWAKYGEVVRQQMAHAAERFADYYYRGWFWPEEDRVAGAPPSQPGHGGGGGPDAGGSDGGNGGGSGGESGGSGFGGDPFTGVPGGGIDNPLAPDPGGAGGDAPLQCGVGGNDSPAMSPIGNAATYTQVGNPIDLGTGNKLQTEADYRSWRPAGLLFTRHYNSVLGAEDRGLGHGWRYSYQRAIVLADVPDVVTVWRDDGSQYHFEWRDGQWLPPLGIVEQLVPIDDEQGVRRGWTYTTADDQLEHYDADGRLVRIDHPSGPVHRLHYDSESRLIRIDDNRGDSMSLQWRGAHLYRVTLPDGVRLVYDYDGRLNLVEVVRRDEGLRGLFAGLRTPERRYHYEDTRHPHALTGMDDATGQRFATWNYDSLGRAVTSEHGEGAERITLAYRRPADTSSRERTVEVTNAAGAVVIYTLEPARAGRYRLKAIDGRPLLNCAVVAQRHHYDERGFLVSRYDADGIGSEYRRDALGRIIEVRDGLRFDANRQGRPGSGATRIDYRWQGRTSHLLAATRYGWVGERGDATAHWQPVARHEWQRDPRARLVSETITDLTAAAGDSAPRTTRYRYIDSERAGGDQPSLRTLEVTDPLGHVTSYHYDSDERLQAIVNALGQRTQFADHTRTAQPRRVTLPDGQQLHIAYDTRGLPIRFERRPAGSLAGAGNPVPPVEITRIDYDAEGRTTVVERPDGSSGHYRYNAAGQLIELRNGWGERIALTPSALHGHWQEQWRYDASGDPALRWLRNFNALGQLATVSHGDSAETRYRYDARGDLIEWHEGHENPARAESVRVTQARYDTRHRLLEWIDAAGHATRYNRDASGAIAAITDGSGNTTSYRRNGFGEIVHQHSPATGDEWRRHDGNGNLIAKGATAATLDVSDIEPLDGIRFRYDALDRLIAVDYPGDADDIAYLYDQTGPEYGNGLGRLTTITTATQTLTYRYDALGRKIAETARDKHPEVTTDSTATTRTYRYETGGRLAAIGYPDGSEALYHYDNERIVSVSWREADTTTTYTLVEAIDYAPFGSPIAWTYGNGLTQTKRLDFSGRITDITLRSKPGLPWSSRDATDPPVWSQRYGYNLYRNIERLTVDGEPRQFGYDAVDQLVNEIDENSHIGYTYDPVGNRISERRDGSVTDYRYDSGNRLTRRGDTEVLIDDRGNLLGERTSRFDGDVSRHYLYNRRNRPALLVENGQPRASYGYSITGLRERKTLFDELGNATTTRYAYLPDGRLLAEQSDNWSVHYVWLGSQPIAIIENTNHNASSQPTIRYLHADHLHTPRVATDAEKRIVWRWYSDAFGTTPAETDPDGDGLHAHINLRFPGQYHDAESGLYYNVFRYYDPAQGRYTQSDPIGLRGGINTFGYVEQNSIAFADPLGLARLQYIMIDNFGGNPTNPGSSTLGAGVNPRLQHFAFYLTDIAGAPGQSMLYDPNGAFSGLNSNGAVGWNGSVAGTNHWQSFQQYYGNSMNTGVWAVIDDFDDDQAAELFNLLVGYNPVTGTLASSCAFLPGIVGGLPNLPAGFYSYDNYRFPSYVHLLQKPIFLEAQIPPADDPRYVDLSVVPWGDLTFDAEGGDSPTKANFSRKPHVPNNQGRVIGGSGITIGRGLDLGSYKATNAAHLAYLRAAFTRAGLTSAQSNALIDAVELRGQEALNYLNATPALAGITLTREQQYLLYLEIYYQHAARTPQLSDRTSSARVLYEQHIQGATGTVWNDLDVRIRDVLVDLQYRGDFRGLSVGATVPGFDQFTQSFRAAASSNDVSAMCRVMADENVWIRAVYPPGSTPPNGKNVGDRIWDVPEQRFYARRNSLGYVGNACP